MEFIQQIKEHYLTLGRNVFLLHGNTNDLFLSGEQELRLRDYLVQELFASRDIVLFFNPGSGIKFYNEQSRNAFMQLIQGYDALQGTKYFNQLPSSYGEIMRLLDRFIRIQGKSQSIAIVIDYAELLFPNQDLSDLDQSDISATVAVLEWTKSHEVINHNVTVCLIAETLIQVNNLLTKSEQVVKLEVPAPDTELRRQLISKFSRQFAVELPQTQKSLAELTTGFTTEGLLRLFQAQQKQKLELNQIKQHKKSLIENRAQGLVEFVETDKNLEMVAGHEQAKKRLRQDAKLMQQGKREVMPMGYLIAGPVGTGKSFLAECFAGEIGIPVVKLQNFRERWVGATEANWERILTTIKSLAPILVIIDEADAALGNREQEGDSGTQQRVFAKLAETMGDTRNRGKILWMLLTSRPELLPVDLKRQGRAEVHIPLLYPQTVTEKVAMFTALAKKVGFEIDDYTKSLKTFNLSEVNSGADIESILVKAKREQLLQNQKLSITNFQQIVQSFRSSLDPQKINAQIAAALAEVTDRDLLEVPTGQ